LIPAPRHHCSVKASALMLQLAAVVALLGHVAVCIQPLQ
jgi:hypothetical protein